MSRRLWVACAFASALAGWTTWGNLQATRRTLHAAPLAENVDRYELLRGRFTTDTVVGYASDLRPGTDEFTARYMSAKYALAPLIIETTDEHRFVIADFTVDRALSLYVKQSGGVLRSHADVGLGLVERPEHAR